MNILVFLIGQDVICEYGIIISEVKEGCISCQDCSPLQFPIPRSLSELFRLLQSTPFWSVDKKNFLAFLHGQNFFLFKKLQLVGKFPAKVTEKTKVY